MLNVYRRYNLAIAILTVALPSFVSGMTPIALALNTATQNLTQLTGSNAPSMGGTANAPLTVTNSSHAVVMQYEAWFGPNAVTFQGAEAMPILQSADMQGVGGGYDSTDPAVIKQHLLWMQYMGIDAAMIEVTNNVGCIFSTGPVSSQFCSPATAGFRQNNQNILNNTGNLYPAWANLKTSIKLIPVLGCLSNKDLAVGSDGKSGLQKEAEYFGQLMAKYPQLNVIYMGLPVMAIYVGTPVNTNLLAQAKAMLHATGLDTKYTFQIEGGFLESQWLFWANPNEFPKAPILMAPKYNFWSWVDRLKPAYQYYPTYNLYPVGTSSRVENLTVSISTTGQTGWGCPQPKYCSDDALRYQNGGSVYSTFNSFMTIANQLNPIFLFVHQFNEFSIGDEGWDPNTSDDIEATQITNTWGLGQGWGYSALQAVHDQIQAYRNQTKS